MSVDVLDLRAFYDSPLGSVAQRKIARVVDAFLGPVNGLRVLGLGYATPFLSGVRGNCERTLAFMPAQQGATNWPEGPISACALADPLMMPLPDASIDRVLVVHALEVVASPAELLHEVARILVPGGRLAMVVPNRRGLWARRDATPFGHGQPFSRSQLRNLLRETQLSPEGWSEVLYVPPFRNRFLIQTAGAWERIGIGFGLPFAGLHVVEATRQLCRPIPVRARCRKVSRVRGRVLVPAAAAPRVVLGGEAAPDLSTSGPQPPV